jgi:hypothetical protein
MLVQLDGFPHHRNAEYSDLLVSHWPNAQFLRTEIRTRTEIPLWNPLILSGAPLVADPLFSIWYPPSWLTLVLPISVAFNLLFILHLAWAGYGMFVLLQAEGTGRIAAVMGGLAFGATPKLIGHISLGHLGLISAVAWTPWVLICLRKFLESVFVDQHGYYRWAGLSGGVLALTFFADPRWLIPVGGLSFLYAVYQIGRNSWSINSQKQPFILTLLIFGFSSLGVSAGLSLPLSEFLSHTTRTNITPEIATEISFPTNNLIKFIVPDLGGWPETLPYVGLIVLGLALIGVVARRQGWKFWLLIFLGALLLAMGDQTPIYGLIVKIIPGMKVTRVPARFLFLCAFGLSVLSGLGFEVLINGGVERLPTIRLSAFGFGAIGVLLGFALIFMGENTLRIGIILLNLAIAFVFLSYIATQTNIRKQVIIGLWIGAMIVELVIFRGSVLHMVPEEIAFLRNQELIETITTEGDESRILSISYSLPQHLAALEDFQLADGVNPLQLQGYQSYMAGALGYSEGVYSVTLPPFPNGDPSTPQEFILNVEDLGQLNIAFIISEYPIAAEGISHVGTLSGSYIYRNEHFRPRAWIVEDGSDSGNWKEATSIEWSPNEIAVQAVGPGTLVLSEMGYPGWVVTIDGKPGKIEQYREIFRAVSLQPGDHEIQFSFRPRIVYVGTAITLISLIAIAWLWIKR